MLNMKTIRETSDDLEKIDALYRTAFPDNERRPLSPLLTDRSGQGEVVAFYNEEEFCGFACLLRSGNISHIIYFAIEESLRGKGMGSAALAAMREREKGQRLIVDIEVEREGAPNNEQRRKRQAFYERSGYRGTQVHYDWRGESYRILSNGGDVSKKEFIRFWQDLERTNDQLSGY